MIINMAIILIAVVLVAVVLLDKNKPIYMAIPIITSYAITICFIVLGELFINIESGLVLLVPNGVILALVLVGDNK